MNEEAPAGIPVPSYLLPVIGALATFSAGLLVADDLAAYWRPGLAPVIGAIFGLFVARPIARNRTAAAERRGEIAGAAFGEAATYAAALEGPEPGPKPARRSAKKAPPKPRDPARRSR